MNAKDIVMKSPGPFALAGVVAIFFAMFVGLPKVGPLAWADDLNVKIDQKAEEVQTEVSKAVSAAQSATAQTVALKVQLLERDLFSAIIEKCEARRRGSGARVWTERIQTLKVEYQRLTTLVYDEPDCSDL